MPRTRFDDEMDRILARLPPLAPGAAAPDYSADPDALASLAAVSAQTPEEEEKKRGILSTLGAIMNAPKRAVGVAANYYAGGPLQQRVLTGEEPVPAGTLLAEGLAGRPDVSQSPAEQHARGVGRAVGEFVGDMATDPVNAGLMLAGLPGGPVGSAAKWLFRAMMAKATAEGVARTYENYRREGWTPTTSEEGAKAALSGLTLGSTFLGGAPREPLNANPEGWTAGGENAETGVMPLRPPVVYAREIPREPGAPRAPRLPPAPPDYGAYPAQIAPGYPLPPGPEAGVGEAGAEVPPPPRPPVAPPGPPALPEVNIPKTPDQMSDEALLSTLSGIEGAIRTSIQQNDLTRAMDLRRHRSALQDLYRARRYGPDYVVGRAGDLLQLRDQLQQERAGGVDMNRALQIEESLQIIEAELQHASLGATAAAAPGAATGPAAPPRPPVMPETAPVTAPGPAPSRMPHVATQEPPATAEPLTPLEGVQAGKLATRPGIQELLERAQAEGAGQPEAPRPEEAKVLTGGEAAGAGARAGAQEPPPPVEVLPPAPGPMPPPGAPVVDVTPPAPRLRIPAPTPAPAPRPEPAPPASVPVPTAAAGPQPAPTAPPLPSPAPRAGPAEEEAPSIPGRALTPKESTRKPQAAPKVGQFDLDGEPYWSNNHMIVHGRARGASKLAVAPEAIVKATAADVPAQPIGFEEGSPAITQLHGRTTPERVPAVWLQGAIRPGQPVSVPVDPDYFHTVRAAGEGEWRVDRKGTRATLYGPEGRLVGSIARLHAERTPPEDLQPLPARGAPTADVAAVAQHQAALEDAKDKAGKVRWAKVPDPPRDEEGNRILPGQEDWTPARRALVHATADDAVRQVAEEERLEPTGPRDIVDENGRARREGQRVGRANRDMGRGWEGERETFAVGSKKPGTAVEDVNLGPKEMVAALKRDKGNPEETEIHQAVDKWNTEFAYRHASEIQTDPLWSRGYPDEIAAGLRDRQRAGAPPEPAPVETAPRRPLYEKTKEGDQALIPGTLEAAAGTRAPKPPETFAEAPLFRQDEEAAARERQAAFERAQQPLPIEDRLATVEKENAALKEQRLAQLEAENKALAEKVAPVKALPRLAEVTADGGQLTLAFHRAEGTVDKETLRSFLQPMAPEHSVNLESVDTSHGLNPDLQVFKATFWNKANQLDPAAAKQVEQALGGRMRREPPLPMVEDQAKEIGERLARAGATPGMLGPWDGHGDRPGSLQPDPTDRKLTAWLRVRDAARDLGAEMKDGIVRPDTQRQAFGAREAFVSKYGALHNATAFAADPDYALTLALEDWTPPSEKVPGKVAPIRAAAAKPSKLLTTDQISEQEFGERLAQAVDEAGPTAAKQAAEDADDAYQAELERVYGKEAGDARYDLARNTATPELFRLRQAKDEADRVNLRHGGGGQQPPPPTKPAPPGAPEAEPPESKWKKIVDGAKKRNRKRARGGTANMGVDPEHLADVAIEGADLAYRGAKSFGSWSEAMMRTVGRMFGGLRDFLAGIWRAIRRLFSPAEREGAPREEAGAGGGEPPRPPRPPRMPPRGEAPEPEGRRGPEPFTGAAARRAGEAAAHAGEEPMPERGKPGGRPDDPINFRRTQTEEDVADYEKRFVDAAREEFANARRPMTFDEIKRLALQNGYTAEEVIRLQKLHGVLDAAQITGGRRARETAAAFATEKLRDWRDLQKRFSEETDEKVKARLKEEVLEAQREYFIANSKFGAIALHSVAAGTEIGRALAAMRIASEPLSPLELTFQKLLRGAINQKQADALADALLRKDAAAVTRIAREMNKPKVWDYVREYWVNSLISGLPTFAAKRLSDVAFESFLRIPERGVAGVLEKGPRQFFERMFGRKVSPEPERWTREMQEAFKAHLNANFGLMDSLKAAADYLIHPDKAELDLFTFGELHPPAIPGPFGTVIRSASRIIKGLDYGAKYAAMQSEVAARILRQVMGEAQKSGIAWDEAHVQARMGELQDQFGRFADIMTRKQMGEVLSREENRYVAQNPKLQAMYDGSMAAARQATFQDQVDPLTRAFMQMRHQHPWISLFVPFMAVPSRILANALQRSPFGAYSVFRRAQTGELTGGALSDEMAKVVWGNLLGAGLYLAARQGFITGSGPTDPDAQRVWRDTGKVPYAVKFGNTWVSLSRMEPLGTTIGWAGDLAEATDPKTAGHLYDKLLQSLTTNLVQKTYLQGIVSLSEAIGDPAREGPLALRRMAGVVVPNIFAKAAQAIDPVVRETPDISSTILSRIPILSESVPARHGGTGEEITRPEDVVSRFASPFRYSPEAGPEKNLERIFLETGYIPSSSPKNMVVPGTEGKSIDLTPDERATYAGYASRATEFARGLAEDDSFTNLPPVAQEEVLRRIYRYSHDAAHEALLASVMQRVSGGEVEWRERKRK